MMVDVMMILSMEERTAQLVSLISNLRYYVTTTRSNFVLPCWLGSLSLSQDSVIGRWLRCGIESMCTHVCVTSQSTVSRPCYRRNNIIISPSMYMFNNQSEYYT